MAINQTVLLPRQQEDAFDKLLKGLQIAQGVYGIKTAIEQSDLRSFQKQQIRQKAVDEEIERMSKQEAKDFKNRGGLTQDDLMKVVSVDKGTKGARQGLILNSEAQEVPFFYKTQADLQRDKLNIDANNAKTEKYEREARELSDKIISFSGSKKINDLVDSYDTSLRVSTLLDLKNPISDSFVTRQLFRMSGDVGAIRPDDLKELGADPSLPAQFKLAIEKGVFGDRISEDARPYIKQTAEVIKQVALKRLNREASTFSEQLASGYSNFSSGDILNSVNIQGRLIQPDLLQQEIRNILNTPQQQNGIMPKSQNMPLFGSGQPLPITNIKQGMMGGNVINWVSNIFGSTGTQDSSKMDDATFLKNYRGQ